MRIGKTQISELEESNDELGRFDRERNRHHSGTARSTLHHSNVFTTSLLGHPALSPADVDIESVTPFHHDLCDFEYSQLGTRIRIRDVEAEG